jgi:hypothetical protein
LARIHDLVTRNQDGALTPAERADLESYLRVSSFRDLMHAKGRRSLKAPRVLRPLPDPPRRIMLLFNTCPISAHAPVIA